MLQSATGFVWQRKGEAISNVILLTDQVLEDQG